MGDNITSTPQIIKAASACVWRGGKVLLARRGKALGKGLWSLPGGKLEKHETPREAAIRELLEETGVIADLQHFLGDFTIDTGAVCYVISCFSGAYVSGEAKPASDSDALEWVAPDDLNRFQLAPNTRTAIEAGYKFLSL